MDFLIPEAYKRLQQRCYELAEDFAQRTAMHDREASHPTENYAVLIASVDANTLNSTAQYPVVRRHSARAVSQNTEGQRR